MDLSNHQTWTNRWATIATIAISSSAVTYATIRYLEARNRRAEGHRYIPSSIFPTSCIDDHSQYENPAFLTSPDKAANLNSNNSVRRQSRADPYDPQPRKDYLSWDDYFMAVAFLSSQRSKDPNKQVGACIVDQQNVICGIGYNGFPRGCPDSKLPWSKLSRTGSKLETKYPYVCHAEMNAILNKNNSSVAGAKVYVTMFPCNECAKLMIQAGIAEIVFHEDKVQPKAETPGASNFKLADQYSASKKLLALAGVKIRQHLFKRDINLVLTNTGMITRDGRGEHGYVDDSRLGNSGDALVTRLFEN
jgi:dCMP deaminase